MQTPVSAYLFDTRDMPGCFNDASKHDQVACAAKGGAFYLLLALLPSLG